MIVGQTSNNEMLVIFVWESCLSLIMLVCLFDFCWCYLVVYWCFLFFFFPGFVGCCCWARDGIRCISAYKQKLFGTVWMVIHGTRPFFSHRQILWKDASASPVSRKSLRKPCSEGCLVCAMNNGCSSHIIPSHPFCEPWFAPVDFLKPPPSRQRIKPWRKVEMARLTSLNKYRDVARGWDRSWAAWDSQGRARGTSNSFG